jgi:Mn2+/Fe2+ NRAMP family transporter
VPLAIIPILLFLVVGEPVTLLKTAGIIEAVHIPIVTALVLYLNHRSLPRGLRASAPVFWLTVFAGTFFAVFAGFFLLQELGAI